MPAGYVKAKEQWIQGANAASYQQNRFWTQAANDLGDAVAKYGSARTSGYTTAEAQLRQLASLPDAMLSPEQQSEYSQDMRALNQFFDTPGAYT